MKPVYLSIQIWRKWKAKKC